MVDYGASLDLESSVVTGNSGSQGAGIYVTNASATVTGSELTDHYTSASGAALYAWASSVDLVDSLVEGNTASSRGGGYISEGGSTLTCTGDAATRSGFLANGVYAVWLEGSGNTFTSDACDFGEASTSDDNTPTDIYDATSGDTFSYGDDASFTCASGACS